MSAASSRPSVLNHVSRVEDAVEEYQRLEGTRSGLQINFAMMFAVLALLLLLAAVWVGLVFANQLARPISGLIAAAERARGGDLSVRVREGGVGDEIGLLSRAFNRMTSQLESQRGDLIEANRQLDARRLFTEAVLAGVSAGVIGLDAKGRVNLPNRSASVLLGLDMDKLVGRPLGQAVPEMATLLGRVRRLPQGLAQSQIMLRRDGRLRTLLVRITAERDDGEIKGFVVTFDEITELLAAQRKAAWADVARRIAHEIKNPLTPIQLSAERLKRKYLGEITSDPENFEYCTDTIVRQVGDIGRMVDEFSAFARMPAPVMKSEDLGDLIRRAVFLQKSASRDIGYRIELPDAAVHLRCDGRQIGQALTNLLKNATESIESRDPPAARSLAPGEVRVAVASGRERTVVTIEDNGRGLPAELRDHLTEPYVTTRAKGTGLGLAIVRKIMEDHGGDVALEDRAEGGARVRLSFRDRAGGQADGRGSAPSKRAEGPSAHAS